MKLAAGRDKDQSDIENMIGGLTPAEWQADRSVLAGFAPDEVPDLDQQGWIGAANRENADLMRWLAQPPPEQPITDFRDIRQRALQNALEPRQPEREGPQAGRDVLD